MKVERDVEKTKKAVQQLSKVFNKIGRRSEEKSFKKHAKDKIEEETGKENGSSQLVLTQEDRVYLVTTNQQIAEHAKKKELSAAKELYQELIKKGIANNHTFSSIVNAALRCGDYQYIDFVIQDLIKLKKKLIDDVVLCTTLIKSYCNQGKLNEVNNLLHDMIYKSKKVSRPNIRTINTLLRGFVQYGLVQDAERCFQIMKNTSQLEVTPDASSFDYLISLQAQNLDMNSIMPTLGRVVKADDGTILDNFTLTSLFIKMTKANIFMGDWKLATKNIQQASNYLKQLQSEATEEDFQRQQQQQQTSSSATSMKQQVLGGKRAWKSTDMSNHQLSVDANRNQSLQIYRGHIREEFTTDVKYLAEFIQSERTATPSKIDFILKRVLPSFARLLVFGYADIYALNETSLDHARSLASALFHQFGVGTILKEFSSRELHQYFTRKYFPIRDALPSFAQKKESKRAKERRDSIADEQREYLALIEKLSNPQARDLAESVHRLLIDTIPSYFQLSAENTYFRLENIFNCKKAEKKFKLEVCSGAGEWAITQAKADSESCWMTLEVKVDRVYQTFQKMVFENVQNLLAIAGDAMTILPRHFSEQSVDEIFVNHPEPPQQQGGEDSEAKHLLDESFFVEVQRILRFHGICTIVTDNLWYGKLLTRLIGKAITQSTSRCNNLHNVKNADWQVEYTAENVNLYVGEPGLEAGHVVSASSYFDRLWSRSDIKARYFIVLTKSPVRNRVKLQIPSQQIVVDTGKEIVAGSVGQKRNHIVFDNDDEDANDQTSDSHQEIKENETQPTTHIVEKGGNDDTTGNDSDVEDDHVEEIISDEIAQDIAKKLKELQQEGTSTLNNKGLDKKKKKKIDKKKIVKVDTNEGPVKKKRRY